MREKKLPVDEERLVILVTMGRRIGDLSFNKKVGLRCRINFTLFVGKDFNRSNI